MSKEQKKKPPKERAKQYDEKVKFDGTLEQMINIAISTKPKKQDK